MINFLNITYLKSGTEKQQKAYQILTTNNILEKLNSYTPILVGTIPINIDIETSDLDIVCNIQDKEEFKNVLKTYFSNENRFIISENSTHNSIKANFLIEDFEIEIFGQNIPSQEQNGYRHMLIEHKVLVEKGEAFRQKIVKLKKQGYKTEPAFAKLLGLTGNAYEALLNL